MSNEAISKPGDDQPWYHQGLRFRCAGCGGCCTGEPGYVWVNKAEIEALAAAIHGDAEQFEQRYVRLIGIRRSLVEFPNGDCVFFDGERRTCQVYEVRPRQCRTWPFWESNLRTPQTWEAMSTDCPGANRGPVVALEKIRAQSRIVAL
jgi:Fe-S-cluster containining protein